MKILWQALRSALKFLLRLVVVSQKFLRASLALRLRTSYGCRSNTKYTIDALSFALCWSLLLDRVTLHNGQMEYKVQISNSRNMFDISYPVDIFGVPRRGGLPDQV